MADSSAGEGRPDPDTGTRSSDRRRTIDLVRVERGEPERRNLRRGERRGPVDESGRTTSSGEEAE